MIRIMLAFIAGAAVVALVTVVRPMLATPQPSEHISDAAAEASQSMRDSLAPYMTDLITGDITTRREILDQHFYGPRIEEARALYPVTESVREIAGVYTEVFEPAGGVDPALQSRVLINLHGGGFSMGARTEGRLESIPVAAVSGMRVISVDYRQGPEHRFPAATEDVVSVYQALLQDYKPEHVGIFGCSAGGLLTAQVVAWLAANELPLPGAAGIFCAGAGFFRSGDAEQITELFGSDIGGGDIAYFENASWSDPLVAPQEHSSVLARFPPTLLITSTRDLAMSSALVTHQRLVAERVPAQLHVYEGLGHYFFADTALPESRHVFDVIAEFFLRELDDASYAEPIEEET